MINWMAKLLAPTGLSLSHYTTSATKGSLKLASAVNAATSATTSDISNAKYLRVKLRRGIIGLPDRFREHTRALGLRHTHQKSYVSINPFTLGNILRVKELVEVRPVKGKPIANARYWPKGYQIIASKNANSE